MSQLKSQTKGLLARWYLRLSRFIPLMKLKYKPGRANVVGDSLSRAQGEPSAREVCLVTSGDTEDPVLTKVQREQQQDEELADLVRYLVSRVLPDCLVRREKVLSAGITSTNFITLQTWSSKSF